MECPRDIAEVILEMVGHGIVRIRLFGGVNDAKKCFVEADHVHNLPALVAGYHPDLLRFYWNTERPLFMRQVPDDERRDWEPLWHRLETLMQRHGILLPEKAAG
jgi:hypothetical protein